MIELDVTEIHVWPGVAIGIPVACGFAHCVSIGCGTRARRSVSFRKTPNGFHHCSRVLRSLLSQYLAQPAESITLVDGPKGKPRIEPESSPHFNVSHSGELAIFAFSRCEIGADIEIIRGLKEMDGIAERFFCADECDQLRSSQSADKERAFFRCWTRKEAYIKAIGEGLSAPLDQFQVTLRAEDTARFVHINNDVNEAAAWTMHNLDIDPTYAGAVAYRHSPRTLRLMAATHPVDILQQLG